VFQVPFITIPSTILTSTDVETEKEIKVVYTSAYLLKNETISENPFISQKLLIDNVKIYSPILGESEFYNSTITTTAFTSPSYLPVQVYSTYMYDVRKFNVKSGGSNYPLELVSQDVPIVVIFPYDANSHSIGNYMTTIDYQTLAVTMEGGYPTLRMKVTYYIKIPASYTPIGIAYTTPSSVSKYGERSILLPFFKIGSSHATEKVTRDELIDQIAKQWISTDPWISKDYVSNYGDRDAFKNNILENAFIFDDSLINFPIKTIVGKELNDLMAKLLYIGGSIYFSEGPSAPKNLKANTHVPAIIEISDDDNVIKKDIVRSVRKVMPPYFSMASFSLIPTLAISGCVKTAEGIAW
jgi:hypothetical protein